MLAVVGLVVIATLAVVVARRFGSGSRRAQDVIPRFYRRALGALARHGIRPAVGETAREFQLRVGGIAPACRQPLAALTTQYERVRFGAAMLSDAEIAALDASLAALRLRVRER